MAPPSKFRSAHPRKAAEQCVQCASKTYRATKTCRGAKTRKSPKTRMETVSFTVRITPHFPPATSQEIMRGVTVEAMLGRVMRDYLPGLVTNAAALHTTQHKSLSVATEPEESGGAFKVVFVRHATGTFDSKKFARNVSRAIDRTVRVDNIQID